MTAERINTPLPIGHSFFERVIEDAYYYVDKTPFIKDLLDKGALVTLCTRPRRFGKTLNQTMLKCFFEDTAQVGGKNTRPLFNSLKIESYGEKYLRHQGKYPVVFLSFKEAKRHNFEDSYGNLADCIAYEFSRHEYVKEKILKESGRDLFEKLSSGKGTQKEYCESLKFLCECLQNYHGQKAVILIDEYDVPLENAWFNGFYGEMINFIRPLMSSTFKDNTALQFSVITGCLRVSKESIFTGLNNLDIMSILSVQYDEYFGFTQDEVETVLAYYGFENDVETTKKWYNGYVFGNAEVYNPWSVIKRVSDLKAYIKCLPSPYWVNTSSNDIIRKLVYKVGNESKEELETLMAGGTIFKAIHEDITYDEIEKKVNNLWNFLFFTGYLKKVGENNQGDNGELLLNLSIPNFELNYIYNRKIQEWFDECVITKNLELFFDSVLNGNLDVFQTELSKLLAESISFMDCAENFYHGFMVGILSRLDGYLVKSNRESGNGRSDLVLYSANGIDDKAIIFELKTAKKFNDLPLVCDEALKQIEKNNYAAEWYEDGYRSISKYGIGFYKKKCEVRTAE